MKNKILFISLLCSVTFFTSAHASSVRTYIKNGTVTINGKAYDEIIVKCKSSIKVKNTIIREEGSRTWCSGIEPTLCFSRFEMKAAQSVCKKSYLKRLASTATDTTTNVNTESVKVADVSAQESSANDVSEKIRPIEKAPVRNDDARENTADLNNAQQEEELRKELIQIEEQRIQMKQKQLELRQKELELQKRELES